MIFIFIKEVAHNAAIIRSGLLLRSEQDETTCTGSALLMLCLSLHTRHTIVSFIKNDTTTPATLMTDVPLYRYVRYNCRDL